MRDANAQQVRIAVRKPNVALPGPLAHAEVVIERRRDA
jgi:dihydroneopterin aldolase